MADALVRDDKFLSIGTMQYLLVPTLEIIKAADKWLGHTHLVVVVVATWRDDQEQITRPRLQSFLHNVLLHDDIFQLDFLANVLFCGVKEGELDPDASKLLEEWGTSNIEYVASESFRRQVVQGPYVIQGGQLWQPWRLYDDHAESLMMSFMPVDLNERKPCKVLDSRGCSTQIRVAVPPRSYFQRSSEKPLDGVRIVIKDSFDIAGFPTSLCNRAWRELYPAPLNTAPCVQKLIEQRAIIVGKAKLQAMIVREDTMECVDFLAPFNPRGDGYQTASGSSNGSCASIGTYDWLDFSIGSDTNASGRKPGQYNGCFAIRPTHGVLDNRGVVGYFPLFDVPCFFSRDFTQFPAFAESWYGASGYLKSPNKSKTALLYPLDYLPTVNEAQMRLIDSFVGNLEAVLGVKKTLLSLKNTWAEDPPTGADSDMSEYLKTVRHMCANLPDEVAKDITLSERDHQYERLLVQRNWLRERIFKAQNADQPNILMVLPIEDGKPNYRERPPQPYEKASALSPVYISSVAGTPEIVAPIGEVPFKSEVTERIEPLPMAVSVVGAPGTDLHLMEVVRKAMQLGGLQIKLETGRSIYGISTAYPP